MDQHLRITEKPLTTKRRAIARKRCSRQRGISLSLLLFMSGGAEAAVQVMSDLLKRRRLQSAPARAWLLYVVTVNVAPGDHERHKDDAKADVEGILGEGR